MKFNYRSQVPAISNTGIPEINSFSNPDMVDVNTASLPKSKDATCAQ